MVRNHDVSVATAAAFGKLAGVVCGHPAYVFDMYVELVSAVLSSQQYILVSATPQVQFNDWWAGSPPFGLFYFMEHMP